MAICSVNRMFVLRSNVSFMCSFIELCHASLNFNTSESLISLLLLFISRFQSERESGDRNFAIGYYLKEKKVDLFCLLYFEG